MASEVTPASQPARLVSIDGVTVRADTAYTDSSGRERNDLRERVECAVQSLREALGRVLEPGETVLFAARADVRPGVLEQLTAGYYIRFYSRVTLVLTNTRLLCFFVNRAGGWLRSLRVVRWGDLDKAKIALGINQTLELRFRSGKSERFWRLKRADAKKVMLLLPALVAEGGGGGSPGAEWSALCPGCLAALTPGEDRCARCGITFKSEGTLRRWALWMPGGGYFYAGQPAAGVIHFLAEAYLIGLTLWGLYSWRNPPASPNGAPGDPATYLILAVFFGALLALEKWSTLHQCRRLISYFIPEK
ncbi:MAG TPA: hypothetical protein VL523_06590 [Terriglobia bacterium]|nr:hypothetical protein [Terriglobia bacterium]